MPMKEKLLRRNNFTKLKTGFTSIDITARSVSSAQRRLNCTHRLYTRKMSGVRVIDECTRGIKGIFKKT